MQKRIQDDRLLKRLPLKDRRRQEEIRQLICHDNEILTV
jgi:hypothetical protein